MTKKLSQIVVEEERNFHSRRHGINKGANTQTDRQKVSMEHIKHQQHHEGTIPQPIQR
ncbi:hypothetical protein BH18THE2_BH18THE2_31580 [soil metagenome]